jgi:excisionase family DNA binding protein
MDITEYETVQDTAKRLKKSRERISQLIQNNQIPDAVKIGNLYLIPKSFVPPNIDYRTTEGRRLKESRKMFEENKPKK